jgi:hypothetical protein
VLCLGKLLLILLTDGHVRAEYGARKKVSALERQTHTRMNPTYLYHTLIPFAVASG